MNEEQNHRRLTFDNYNTTITSTRTDVITGYYMVPSTGRYYIEIIELLCNDFPFEKNPNSNCLEDALNNHLTAPDTFIDVTITSNTMLTKTTTKDLFSSLASSAMPPVGFWKWNNSVTDPVPLTTRYQGQNCRKSREKRCLDNASMDRFKPYAFEWYDPEMNAVADTLFTDFNETFHLCIAGYSHSRALVDQLHSWVVDRFNFTNLKVHILQSKYPKEMKTEIVRAANCNISIVGLGQHPASAGQSFPKYYDELQDGILFWKELGVKMAFRKIHYNPLGDIIAQCPPQDGRSPVLIDGYNEIIRSLARKNNITFIDTGSVMDPMWDSASDWCHYKGLEGRMEALYILQEVFRMNKNNIQGWQEPY